MVMTDELIEFLGELFVEKNIREETGYTFIQFVETFNDFPKEVSHPQGI